MARRQAAPIQTVSCIPLTPDGSEVTYLNDMTDEQRKYVGAKLTERLLSIRYTGKAAFKAELPPCENVFPHFTGQKA